MSDLSASNPPAPAVKPVIVPRFFKNYLAIIQNGAGTEMFRTWYCTVDGVEKEVLGDGNLSCPLYLTAVLKLFDLVQELQITVHRAQAELARCGWTEIKEPRAGAVVVWSEKTGETGVHKHIGFCLEDGLSISTSDEQKKVAIHPLDYRPILSYLWHPKLDEA